MFAKPALSFTDFTPHSISPREWVPDFSAQIGDLDPQAPEFIERARHIFYFWSAFHQAVLDHYWERRGFDDWGRFERSLAQVSLAAARLAIDTPSLDSVRRLAHLIAQAHHLIRGEMPNSIWLGNAPTRAVGQPDPFAEAGRAWRATYPSEKVCVIGARGEGEGRSSAVAVGAQSEITPVTLRIGRTGVNLSPSCAAYLRRQSHRVHFALVHEGRDVAPDALDKIEKWLTENGTSLTRVHRIDALPSLN